MEEALQSEGLVLTRETDLEVIGHYLRSQLPATLHIVLESDEGDVETDVECTYGRTPLGEYIIRWYSESIEDVMTNGKTYLQPNVPGLRLVPEGEQIFFTAMREAFFGDTKAFIICTPARTEGPGVHSS